jgi:Caspase domain
MAPGVNYRALLIGVRDYDSMTKLNSPLADVDAVASALFDEHYGLFDVESVASHYDLTGAEIKRETARFFAGAETTDVLLFYFSGHGLPAGIAEGYLCGKDADEKLPAESCVAFSEVRAMIGDSNALVKVVVLDCCYSGRFKAVTETLEPPSVGKSVHYFRSLSDAERVTPDALTLSTPSAYTAAFAKGLRGAATSRSGDPYIKLEDLAFHLTQQGLMPAPSYLAPEAATTTTPIARSTVWTPNSKPPVVQTLRSARPALPVRPKSAANGKPPSDSSLLPAGRTPAESQPKQNSLVRHRGLISGEMSATVEASIRVTLVRVALSSFEIQRSTEPKSVPGRSLPVGLTHYTGTASQLTPPEGFGPGSSPFSSVRKSTDQTVQCGKCFGRGRTANDCRDCDGIGNRIVTNSVPCVCRQQLGAAIPATWSVEKPEILRQATTLINSFEPNSTPIQLPPPLKPPCSYCPGDGVHQQKVSNPCERCQGNGSEKCKDCDGEKEVRKFEVTTLTAKRCPSRTATSSTEIDGITLSVSDAGGLEVNQKALRLRGRDALFKTIEQAELSGAVISEQQRELVDLPPERDIRRSCHVDGQTFEFIRYNAEVRDRIRGRTSHEVRHALRTDRATYAIEAQAERRREITMVCVVAAFFLILVGATAGWPSGRPPKASGTTVTVVEPPAIDPTNPTILSEETKREPPVVTPIAADTVTGYLSTAPNDCQQAVNALSPRFYATRGKTMSEVCDWWATRMYVDYPRVVPRTASISDATVEAYFVTSDRNGREITVHKILYYLGLAADGQWVIVGQGDP